MELYLKSCDADIVNSNYEVTQALGTVNIVIPKIDATAAQVNTAWSGIGRAEAIFSSSGVLSTTWDNFFQVIEQGYCELPSLRYCTTFPLYLEQTPGSWYRALLPGSKILENEPYSSGFFWLHKDGKGLRCHDDSSADGFVGPDISNVALNAAKYSGVYNKGSNYAGISGLFVTSDNVVYWFNAYISKNNSSLNSFGNNSPTVISWLESLPGPVPEYTDPYLPDGVDPSGTGGGTGTFSETGDTIGIPGLPTLSAVDTGFITLFNPTAAQVKSLANYMWSNTFDLTTFKNIVANPIDCILGLSIVPVDPSNAGSKVVTVGNIATNITLPYLSSQYVEVDCGTLNVQEFWGSYLDYSPYTKMSLYLPYIGIIPLDIDDVMNASIEIKYHVDVLSGACVAYVLCNGTQLYTYVGQCSSNVPITSNDFTNTVNGILGIAGSIGKLAADGGASAPTEAAGIAANAINALKPNIQKSGAMSGTGGLMGVQTPYLICQRPRQSVPASQNVYTGYPANITAKLSDLSGYTEVDYIHLDGLSATQEEQQEIMDLLTSGVII